MIDITTQRLTEKYLVGRTIAQVSTDRVESDHHAPATHVGRIVFTDGSTIILDVAETECEYAVIVSRFKP